MEFSSTPKKIKKIWEEAEKSQRGMLYESTSEYVRNIHSHMSEEDSKHKKKHSGRKQETSLSQPIHTGEGSHFQKHKKKRKHLQRKGENDSFHSQDANISAVVNGLSGDEGYKMDTFVNVDPHKSEWFETENVNKKHTKKSKHFERKSENDESFHYQNMNLSVVNSSHEEVLSEINTSVDTDSLRTEIFEEGVGSKKRKKKRKHFERNGESDDVSVVNSSHRNELSEINTSVDTDSLRTETYEEGVVNKKCKKKRKHFERKGESDDVSVVDSSHRNELSVDSLEEGGVNKKRKKKREHLRRENTSDESFHSQHAIMNSCDGDEKSQINTSVNTIPPQNVPLEAGSVSKKHKKKRKHSERKSKSDNSSGNINSSSDDSVNADISPSVHKHKRKHSKDKTKNNSDNLCANTGLVNSLGGGEEHAEQLQKLEIDGLKREPLPLLDIVSNQDTKILMDSEISNQVLNQSHGSVPSVDFENMSFDDVDDMINMNEDVSPEMITRLSTLQIPLTFKVPESHEIETKISHIPSQAQRSAFDSLNIKMKKGKFNPDEDAIIRKNWERFSEEFRFDDPKPFVSMTIGGKTYIKPEERVNFVKYLGNGLPTRYLNGIYRRFKILFAPRKVLHDRYEDKFDKLILEYKARGIRDPFSKLALASGRDRHSIYKRYCMLLRINKQIEGKSFIDWSEKTAQVIVKNLMEVYGVTDIENLRGRTITLSTWELIAEKCGYDAEAIKQFWNKKLSTQIFATQPIYTTKIISDIVERLIRSDVQHWQDINWQDLSKDLYGADPLFLYRKLTRFKEKIPKEIGSSLKDYLVYLQLNLSTFRHHENVLQRYSVREDGTLIPIDDPPTY